MATELASGFINLTVKYQSGMSKINNDLLGLQRTATKAGTQSGKSFTTALVRNTNSAGNQISKNIFQRTASQASSAGKSSGTSFLSGFKSTSSGVGNHLRSLFSGSGGGGGISVAADGGKKMGGAFATAFKGALSAAGVVGAIATVVGGFKDVAKAGLDYEQAMNAIKGVSGATADQMEAIRQKAAELGSDITLAGTSASDAGNAMLELVKGGLTVEQAMDAVRGTLQLATAAQVSSAEAAQIQANALNAFQLPASEAARVADLLANAANASTGEMTDYAQALQQASAVANLFGIPVEDAVTSLALFAKAGVQGSDAGTMLKTMLQSLTDQGNPAQGAIEELGLTLYDLQGNFVGLPSLFDQLAQAQGRMSPEAYQAATNVLFGSDAMRASGIAAIFGSEGWNQMEASITRAGGAADMAKAQMQGLPGVIEGLKNTWDGFKLVLFGVIDGPLQALGNFMLKMSQGDFSMLPSWLTDGFRQFGDVVKSAMPALQDGWKFLSAEVKEFASQMQPILREHAPKFIQFLKDMKPVAIALGAVLALAFKALIEVLPPVLSLIAKFQQVLWAVTGGAVTAFTAALKAVGTAAMWLWNNAIQPAWNGIQSAVSVAWSVIKTVFDAFKSAISAVGDVFRFVFNDFILPMWQNFQTLVSVAWSAISPIWEGIKTGFQAVGSVFSTVWTSAISPAWEAIKSGISSGWEFISGIFETMKGGFKAVADFIGGVWNGIAGAVKSALDGVVSAIRGPMHTLGDLLAAVPQSLGPIQIPGADTARALGAKLQAFRTGGTVSGPGGTDNVLAWLTAGEGVVTKDAMANGGATLVAALNSGWVPPAEMIRSMVGNIPGFAEGLNPGADFLRSQIMRLWPQITTIGGRRSEDGLGEHSSGNAMDVMIPGYDTPQGKAMGDAIAAFVIKNKEALGLDGLIWRQTSYGYGGSFSTGKAMDDRGSDTQNHMDHLHIILGKGRGAGAPAVDVPTSSLKLPSGGSVSPGSGYGSGGSGGATPKQIQNAQDRVTDLENKLATSEMALAEAEANPKTKASTLQSKRDQVEKNKRELEQAQQELADLESQVGSDGSGGADSNNPYIKIMEGIKEILPDFGGLADIGLGGIKESLLPPGFSDPQEWGITQAASGLLGFFGGLVGGFPGMGPVGSILSGVGSAVGGNASGAANSFMSLLPAPFGEFTPVDPGSSQIVGGSADPAAQAGWDEVRGGALVPEGPGVGAGVTNVDNSVNIAQGGQINENASAVIQRANRNQQALQTPQFGTRRWI